MKITLLDGKRTVLLDVSTGKTDTVNLSQHAMRFHIYDPATNTATKHVGSKSDDLHKMILKWLALHGGGIMNFTSTWLTVKYKRRELWPVDRFMHAAEADLKKYWGDSVKVTGTSMRYIYYVSDGNMKTTPDAIGSFNGRPLVYRGYAIGTIFTINDHDVLRPSNNVVYWLPRKTWNRFHESVRKIPREYPDGPAFLATNWCERMNTSTYKKDGIWIAQMRIGLTIGTWSAGQLREWWRRHEDGIRGDTYKEALFSIPDQKQIANKIAEYIDMVRILKGAPFGLFGSVCPSCGAILDAPFRRCKDCMSFSSMGNLPSTPAVICVLCGKYATHCSCSSPDRIVIFKEDVAWQKDFVNQRMEELS